VKPYHIPALLVAGALLIFGASPEWVLTGPGGRLEYRATERGDRIMDFSSAGYGGGGVAIPELPAVQTLKPEPGDNSARIQAALDVASSAGGGAVVLAPGTFEVERAVTITASDVVLRGSGSDESGTTIRLTGKPHRFLAIRGAWRGAAPALGHGAAGGSLHLHGFHRAHAGHSVFQPQNRRLRSWLGYRLGGRMERTVGISTGGTTARSDQLVHRVHW
jgi:hypothetical protein